MNEQIYITTSNGLFRYDVDSEELRQIFFEPKAPETFGIALDSSTGKIIVAARQRRILYRKKKSRVTRIYEIEPKSLQTKWLGTIRGLRDVHQIAIAGDHLFLTDTGLNRIADFDLPNRRLLRWINVGRDRRDINHVNAVSVLNNQLLIGLNNRGYKDSEILAIDLRTLDESRSRKVDAYDIGRLWTLTGRQHTHDIEPYGERILVCASHEGLVFDAESNKDLFKVGDWARGLAIGAEGIWVGSSERAERARRHHADLKGKLTLYRHGDHAKIREVELEGTGQVNDLISINGELPH